MGKGIALAKGTGAPAKSVSRAKGFGAKAKGFGLAKRFGALGKGFEKEDAIKGGRFFLVAMLAYLLLSVFIKAVFSVEAIELWNANTVLGLLEAAGYHGTVSLGEAAYIELYSGPVIVVSEFCTGLMEILIVVSAIIASFGISWKKRLLGALVAAVAAIWFNVARVFLTILLILGPTDLGLVDFAHNILFRVFLFITIAGLYIAWFYWAVSSEAKKKG